MALSLEKAILGTSEILNQPTKTVHQLRLYALAYVKQFKNIPEVTHTVRAKTKVFTEGQNIAVRNYSHQKNKKCLVGRVVSEDGTLNYTVSVNGHLAKAR